jgi:hypothetical protein
MHMKNQPPVLVPNNCWVEIERLSKAALMDMVWSFATRCAGNEGDPGEIMVELRRERDAILAVRRQAP